LDCYQKYAFAKDGPGRQLFSDADSWIACDDRNWYFSFENICEILEISPDYLRHGVERWKCQASLLASRQPEKSAVDDSNKQMVA
jgi:hypothetical protein